MGETYHLWLQGGDGNALGDLSKPEAVMPKADPDMPSGAMLIENGSEVANARQVTLNFSATDTPLPGAAQGSAAHLTDRYSTMYNEVSGNVKLRVSNHEDMAGAQWQALHAGAALDAGVCRRRLVPGLRPVPGRCAERITDHQRHDLAGRAGWHLLAADHPVGIPALGN